MDPNTTITGHSSACQPNIECWLGSFVVLQEFGPGLLSNPISFVIFSWGWGVWTPCSPSGSAHEYHSVDNKTFFFLQNDHSSRQLLEIQIKSNSTET